MKHLCASCRHNFATCQSRGTVFASDLQPDLTGAEADTVIQCDTYEVSQISPNRPSDSDPLPCPFCGNTPAGVTGWNGGDRAVYCTPCGITGPKGNLGWTDRRAGEQHEKNETEAIRLWNNRSAR